MRKKAHRRINANNREYDRFYVINYLVRASEEELVSSSRTAPDVSVPLSGVRSWGRPGRRCRARTTASWPQTKMMSEYLQQRTFC